MLLAEQFYKEAPLCPAVQHSVQECNSNGVCIIFICHYNHHHYHDMLSVWQSVCNMNDNSSYWSCSSMKHLFLAEKGSLNLRRHQMLVKLLLKLLFAASWSLQHTEKLQQFGSLISSDVSVMFQHQYLCRGLPRKTVNFIQVFPVVHWYQSKTFMAASIYLIENDLEWDQYPGQLGKDSSA